MIKLFKITLKAVTNELGLSATDRVGKSEVIDKLTHLGFFYANFYGQGRTFTKPGHIYPDYLFYIYFFCNLGEPNL